MDKYDIKCARIMVGRVQEIRNSYICNVGLRVLLRSMLRFFYNTCSALYLPISSSNECKVQMKISVLKIKGS